MHSRQPDSPENEREIRSSTGIDNPLMAFADMVAVRGVNAEIGPGVNIACAGGDPRRIFPINQ